MPEDIQQKMDTDATKTETQKHTTAIVIANPSAGSYTQHKQQIEETIEYLNAHDWDVELKLTQSPGDGARLAREAVAQKLNVVVATGGDGTINEVIQELANSDTALGVLPSGTVNVYAREMGIPLDDYAAAREILINGQVRRIDLGKTNERYFMLMSTIGLDAEVTHAVEHKPVKRFGVLGYILLTTWLGLGYPNFNVFIQMSGGRTIRARALQVIFGNTQLYAGAIKFTWRARCDDGLLDICLVHSQNVFGRIGLLVDFLLRRPKRQQWVRYDSTQQVKIHTNIPVAIQVDGDPVGYTNKRGFPATIFSIAPGAIKVIIPQKLPEGLFSKP